MADELQSTQPSTLAAAQQGVGIAGLEEVPASIIPIPFVKLVQPTSRNTQTADGSEAPVGSFLFTDTKNVNESINFVILKAKHGEATFTEKDGTKTTKKVLAILGVIPETEKVFILSLSVMSFSGFGKLVAMLKEQKIEAVWNNRVTVSSHKVENDKGKFYVADFQLGEPLTPEEIAVMGEFYNKYADVVASKSLNEDEEVIAQAGESTKPDLF